jgi:ABC-2 type transport system permease protein
LTWLLLRHEWRLTWRGVRFGRFGAPSIPVLLLIFAGSQIVGLSFGWTIMKARPSEPVLLAGASAVLAWLAGLMLAQALTSVVQALFERQDLVWLLTTPAPFRRLILLRIGALALGVAWPWMLFVGAIANGLAIMGRPGALAVYPVILALGILSVALASALATWLVPLAVLGMVVGALGFVAGQYQTVLTPAQQALVWHWLQPGCCAPPGLPWWPARAALGDPLPLAALVGLCLVGGVASAALVVPRLLRMGAFEPRIRRTVPAGGPVRFRAGVLTTLFWTELRLLRRSLGLLGQAAYPLVYLVPIAVAGWRGGVEVTGSAPVFAAGAIASVLMATAVGADEAAELVQTAPVANRSVLWAKVAAAAAMVGAIMLLPIIAIGVWKPALLPSILVGCAGSTVSGLLLGVWRPDQVRRIDLGSGQRAFRGVDFLQFCVNMAWAGAATLAIEAPRWTPAPIGIAILLLSWAGLRRR